MLIDPFLFLFAEPVKGRPAADSELGTETFTEARENSDQDVDLGTVLGTETETGTFARREDGDNDFECGRVLGTETETFTRAREDGDTDIAPEANYSAAGLWGSEIL